MQISKTLEGIFNICGAEHSVALIPIPKSSDSVLFLLETELKGLQNTQAIIGIEYLEVLKAVADDPPSEGTIFVDLMRKGALGKNVKTFMELWVYADGDTVTLRSNKWFLFAQIKLPEAKFAQMMSEIIAFQKEFRKIEGSPEQLGRLLKSLS